MASTINSDTSNGLILTPDTTGEIQLQSAGVTQAKITSSGLQNASGSAITSQAGKNLIINGDMMIDQRNAGASVTITSNGQYTLDRFQAQMSQASKFSVEQVGVSPAGFYYNLGVTSLSAYTVLAADFFAIEQRIEGYNLLNLNWGISSAETVTLSFWVKSSLTGTFTASLKNGAVDRSFPFTYTIGSANTWEYKTITIPGDTTGAWSTTNTTAMRVNWSLGMGTDYTSGSSGAWQAGDYTGVNGAVNVVSTSGATFNITGIQLEVGEEATPFEQIQYGQQLALCQRYFFRMAGSYYGGSYGSGSFVSGLFPVEMRVTPTITYSSTRTPLIGLGYGYSNTSSVNGYVSASGYVTNLQADSEL